MNIKFFLLLLISILLFSNIVFSLNYKYYNSTKLFVIIPLHTEEAYYKNENLNEINNSLIKALHSMNQNKFKLKEDIYNYLNKSGKNLNEIIKDSNSLKELAENLKVRFIITSYAAKIDERIALSVTINDTKSGENKIIAADKSNCSIKTFIEKIIPKLSKDISKYCNSNK